MINCAKFNTIIDKLEKLTDKEVDDLIEHGACCKQCIEEHQLDVPPPPEIFEKIIEKLRKNE